MKDGIYQHITLKNTYRKVINKQISSAVATVDLARNETNMSEVRRIDRHEWFNKNYTYVAPLVDYDYECLWNARYREEPELKPCPFCGGEARKHFSQLDYSIDCGCGASIYRSEFSITDKYQGNKQDTINAWNRRV